MRIRAAIVALLVAPAALAAGWADFEGVFPVFPCPDGWSGCYAGGERVTPDMRKGSSGLPIPADMRVDFFSLDAGSNFSPWATLSVYEVGQKPEPEPAVVDVEPEPMPVPDEVMPEPYEPEPMPSPGPRPEPVVAPTPSPGPGPMVRPPTPSPEPGPAPMVRPPTPSPEPGPATMVRPPTPSPGPGPMVRPPTPSPGPAPVVAEPAPAPEPAVAPEPEVAVVETPTEVTCDNLLVMEPKAMMGQLSKGERECLDASYQAAPKQTDKDKISRILIANANATDRREWARLLQRHLDEVDQSDPNMSYSYASYLAKVGRNNEAIKWADVALERKDAWSGSTYTSRVYGLYKLRADAANDLWQKAETKLASSPSEATRKAAEDSRQMVKTFSREWYDYAKAAGRDTTAAEKMCVSAAGTAEYCTGG